MPVAPTPPLTRLMARLDTSDPSACWIWPGALNDQGYGQIGEGDRTVHYTHRLMYEAHYGTIPPGLTIDHLCRNRACCNPAHLEAVTRRENTLRGTSPVALQAQQTHCVHGHPLSGDNLYIRPGRHGRMCRACKRARDRAAYARRRAER